MDGYEELLVAPDPQATDHCKWCNAQTYLEFLVLNEKNQLKIHKFANPYLIPVKSWFVLKNFQHRWYQL